MSENPTDGGPLAPGSKVMWSYEPTRYFCTFAIDGPTFASKRVSYWEPQDELSRLTRVDRGLVLLDCKDAAAAERASGLLTDAGFVAGVDFGVGNDSQGEVVACKGITFEFDIYDVVTPRGSTNWQPGPMPEHIHRQYVAAIEAAEDARFAFYQRVAAAVEVDPAAIAKAGEASTHAERMQQLMEAISKPASS